MELQSRVYAAMCKRPLLSRMEQEIEHMVGFSLQLGTEAKGQLSQSCQAPTWNPKKSENSEFMSDLPNYCKGIFLRVGRQNIS